MDTDQTRATTAQTSLMFEAFRATAVDHLDLREVPGTQFHGQGSLYPQPVPGRTYAGSNLCMSLETDGMWVVDFAGHCWQAPLAVAEADLYGVYVSEMAAKPVRAYLRDVMPPNEALTAVDDTLDQLAEIYTGWMLMQGLDLGCAMEALVCREDLSHAQRQWLTRYCERWDAAHARFCRYPRNADTVASRSDAD